MKLLIFIHSLNSGGAERVACNLANHWSTKGWQVSLVTLASTEHDFYQLHPAVQRFALGMSAKSTNLLIGIVSNLRRVRALRTVLRQVQPDVALSLMSTANILLALSALWLKHVAVVGSERIYPPSIPIGRVWEGMRSYFYGKLCAVTAQTSESATWLSRHTRARCVPVIPNAVTWPLTSQPPRLALSEKVEGKRILLAVGRLVEQKGFDLLIQVFKRLAPDFPDWQLVILGDGPCCSALQAQVSSAGLADCIKLPGRAGNISEWYSAADLYVMSSRFEGFPNTLIEAMAHGLPAISFDCKTGPSDIIRHQIDGLLVPQGDLRALEMALCRLMSDESIRKQYSVKSTEVLERFSYSKILHMWEDLFFSIKKAKR